MTGQEASDFRRYVCAHWPHAELWDVGVWKAFRNRLDRVPLEDVYRAVDLMVGSGREFAPTPGQLQAQAIELQAQRLARVPGLPAKKRNWTEAAAEKLGCRPVEAFRQLIGKETPDAS